MRLLVAFAALSLLLAGGVFVGPFFVDWNAYREDLARHVRAEVGVDPVILGNMDVVLAPRPVLRAQNVRLIAAGTDRRKDLARLPRLVAELDPWALLAGDLRLRALTLERPVVTIDRGALGGSAGQLPWQALVGHLVADNPAAVGLGNLTVRQGRLKPAGDGDGAAPLDQIDLTLRHDPATGVRRLKAQANYRKLTLRLSAAASPSGGGTALTFETGIVDTGVTVSGNGVLTRAPAAASRFQVTAEVTNAQRASRMLANAGLNPLGDGVFGAVPVRLTGAVVIADEGLTLEDATLAADGLRATGGLVWSGGAGAGWRGNLTVNRLNLDGVMAHVPAVAANWRENLAHVVAAFPVPTGGPPGSLQIAAAAVTVGGRPLRDVSGRLTLGDGRLGLADLRVMMPGDTLVTGDATVRGVGDGRRVEGTVKVVSGGLRDALAWLGVAPESLTAGRLRSGSTRAEFVLTPAALTLREWSFAFDATQGNGGLTLLLRPRPSFGLSLAVDQLSLDHYAGASDRLTTLGAALLGEGTAPGKQALATLRGFDANLDLRLGALVSGLRTWRDLRLRLGVKDGQVALKTLRVEDVVGVDVRVRGDIDLNQTAPLLSLDFVGGSARLDRLAGYLGESWRRPLRQIGAARVRGRITGAAAAATLETAFEGIGGRAKLTAPVDLTAGLLRGPGSIEIEHPEVATLVGLWNDAWPLAKRSVGPGRLAVRLTPRDDDRHDLRLDLRAGEMTMALAGTMGRLRQLWPLDLTFDIRHPRALGLVRQVTENWWPRGEDIGRLALGGRFSGDNTVFQVSGLSLTAGASVLTGAINYAEGARPRVDAQLTASQLTPVEWLPAAGIAALWPARDRLNRWLTAVDGDLTLAVTDLAVGGATGGTSWHDALLEADLSEGVLTVRRARARREAGLVNLSGTLTGGALPTLAVTLAAEDFNLRGVRLNEDFILRAGRGEGRALLRSVGETFDEMLVNLSGSGDFALTEAILAGIDLTALSVAATPPRRAADFVRDAQRLLSTGTSRFNRAAGSFAVKDGVVQSSDIEITGPAALARVAMAVNLPADEVDLKCRLRLRSPADAPVFGLRLSGPIDNPRRILDVNELRDFVTIGAVN
ncbi:MAG: AsmA-like C-terminal region-containing protein [Pseudomonadota bacterium]|nr:AsmA-like C-terminal region-containing protein [Pseudomonadota bacterium]